MADSYLLSPASAPPTQGITISVAVNSDAGGAASGIAAGGQAPSLSGKKYNSSGATLTNYPTAAFQTLFGSSGSRETLPTPKPFILQSLAGLPGGGVVAGYYWQAGEDIAVGDGISTDANMLIAYNSDGAVVWGALPWSTLDATSAPAGFHGGGVTVTTDRDGNTYAQIETVGTTAAAHRLSKYDSTGAQQWSSTGLAGIICASSVGIVVRLKAGSGSSTITGHNASTGAVVWSRTLSPSGDFGLAISKSQTSKIAVSTGWQYVEYIDAATGDMVWQAEPNASGFVAGLDIADDGSVFVGVDVFGADVQTSVYHYAVDGSLTSTFSGIASDTGGQAGSFFGNDLNGGLIAVGSLFVMGYATFESKTSEFNTWGEYTFSVRAFNQSDGASAWSSSWGIWTDGAFSGETVVRIPEYKLVRALGKSTSGESVDLVKIGGTLVSLRPLSDGEGNRFVVNAKSGNTANCIWATNPANLTGTWKHLWISIDASMVPAQAQIVVGRESLVDGDPLSDRGTVPLAPFQIDAGSVKIGGNIVPITGINVAPDHRSAIRYCCLQVWGRYIEPTSGNLDKVITAGGLIRSPSAAKAAFGPPDFLFYGNASDFLKNRGRRNGGSCRIVGGAPEDYVPAPDAE